MPGSMATGRGCWRLNYAYRLHTGQSIGSGMIEGAAKDVIGKRLKKTGVRWFVKNVPKIGPALLPDLQRWMEGVLG